MQGNSKGIIVLIVATLLLFSCQPANRTENDNSVPEQRSSMVEKSAFETEEVVPPGSLPAVDSIPAADCSAVGTDISVVIHAGETVHYFVSSNILVVIEKHSDIRYAKLTVLQPEWSNLGDIETAIARTPFSAKVMNVVNISFQEYMYTVNVLHDSAESSFSEIPSDVTDVYVSLGNSSRVSYSTLTVKSSAESVFKRIYERFSVFSAF